jgi:hypothetical protein
MTPFVHLTYTNNRMLVRTEERKAGKIGDRQTRGEVPTWSRGWSDSPQLHSRK